ncbi:hypothetical protein HPQ64_04875 [Rhizobiales bacterium]|uniref:hypothetical protein n=1 Tax=Hongsoonwoonella zoysiae TaxID=2821844 RepID=UPI00155FE433|nr:hypothetical protein [Hongsoonwoonella zoysiae]NRG17013.1 hypothetical protein [Hongsoonwoonella zoysiae]
MGRNRASLFILSVLAFNAVLYKISTGAGWDPSETGPFETAQALVLVLSAGVWMLAFRRAEIGMFERWLGVVLTGFAIWFCGREIAWGGIYGVPFALTRGLEIVIVAGILVSLAFQARVWFTQIPNRKRTLLDFAGTWRFFFLVVGAASVLVGDFLDKKILTLQYSQHLEEIFELSGWVCFLFAAICHAWVVMARNAVRADKTAPATDLGASELDR